MNVGRQQRALDAHHDDPGDRPVMRARFEHNGSPRYMLYTMKRLGLDHEHGFHLDVQLVSDELEGGMETVEARLQDGEADLIDIDYISTARERAEGANIVAFHPYGRTVGGLVAPEDTAIEDLADLSGHRIGVVRRLDKNWILVRAACRQYHGFDPDETATPVEAGSKVGLTEMLHDGEVDAVLQFWPIVPEITERGPYEEVFPVSDIVQRLAETDNRVPVSTFLTSDSFLDAHTDTARRFAAAYGDVVDRLIAEDALWDEIGEKLMSYDDPEIVAAVREGWRAMVVRGWNNETIDGMEQLFEHLRSVAGADALGVDRIPEGTFRPVDPI
ncbi:ABC-type transport system periplasmic substrate-binding protein [Natronomonas moolapensis 8.8.11]|uniref:ABC-type transport system periplasmic substrate-binding protein n=1 Tax=Natronomonas moolapensis (strain DSM 18674 / CECT 7526 / JCM 14361 / 8.8.11) TaxID=268739 RepID=M1Y5D2_NATM8|nr:ABC transporter substrate-binding protein [Natronomonas moolapensis]CCQ37772.1 ABC-type transport system periplasmic substrate-binding protein [Natronomonas moolapensis 8.8.11]